MGCGASNNGKKGDGKKGGAKGGKDGLRLQVQNNGRPEEFYEIDTKKLGEGSYGAVKKAKSKETGTIRAIKSISIAQTKNLQRLQQEIDLMKIMDHPNICRLYDSFQDKRNVYLVLELCQGGELFDRIIDAGHFTEREAAYVMQNMFRAIYYMHEMHVCHRDLKPENFLFTTKDPIESATLKLIDFGLAKQYTAGQNLSTKAGTPYYVAPQVLAGKYDQSSDLWSLGVIMYVVLCGYPPFYGDTDADVLQKVRLGNFSFNAADWKNVSEDAKNLIRFLLKMNPKDRYTAEQALNHVWVEKKAPKAENVPIQQGFVDKLRGFRGQNKLKKAALHVIANQMGEEQIKQLKDIFLSLDNNGDGKLTIKEMRDGLAKSDLKEIPADFQAIMDGIDADGSGVIDYTEFLAATLDKKSYVREDACWSAFKEFDKDGSGKISRDELAKVLCNDEVKKHKADNVNLDDLMKELDTDGDGEISFDEFMVMMRG